jgi:lysophospholipase L1-like esterase
VVVRLSFPKASRFSHMPKTGGTGLDLYEKVDGDWRYVKTFVPPYDAETGFESIIHFPEQGMHEVTINMPSYNRVTEIQIGLSNAAKVKRSPDYRYEKPVVFYGSSITQGGCASRPGNAYTSLLCRNCDCNYINLGFSGNGKGETAMAEHIAGLDMSVFVMDYDHNAPAAEYLKNTHYRLYKRYREKRPNTPILFVTRPDITGNAEGEERLKIIYNTYKKAKRKGDKNVYFLSGKSFYGKKNRWDFAVDGCHPTDLGFSKMAEKIYKKMIAIDKKYGD